MNNPLSQQELFTFTELIKSYKSRLKELTEENTELKNIITNGRASNNDLTNQITLLQNKYDEYVKNNPANEIYNEEQIASVAGDKITKLKKIISIKNDEIEKYKKEKSQLLIKLNEANYTIDKLKSQNSINESYKDDNTKFNNINGYGSTFLNAYRFSNIQNIKNKVNPIIKLQLPATSVNLSATLSPSFSVSLSCLSTSTAIG